MAELIDGSGLEVVRVTLASARCIAEAYRIWGKGVHPIVLNFHGCVAYELAKEHACPLLYVGDNFARTDIEAALG